MLKTALRSFFQIPGAPRPGDTLVVAVSGGPDSTALLHALAGLRPVVGVELHAAHFNHGLRGAESQGDEARARELAGSLSVPFTAGTDPGGPRQEAGLRERRYTFLSAVRRNCGATWIATGHTAGDQAETLLMNLLRGAGPTGLGGMLPLGPRDVCRPMLPVPRDDVLAYLNHHHVPYREDPSNRDERHTRNRIRHRLLPLMREAFSPGIVDTLAREAELFASLDDFLRQESRTALEECSLPPRKPGGQPGGQPGGRSLGVEALRSRHPALQREILRRWLEESLGRVPGGAAHLEAALELLRDPGGTSYTHLPGGVRITREYDRLLMETLEAAEDPAPPRPVTLDLAAAGRARWGGHRLAWEVDTRSVNASGETRSSIVLDVRATRGPLRIRSIQPGDRIEPKGMEGSQKVSRLLVDLKVPARMRHEVPVLCDNGGPSGGERVLWVVGHRRSRHACANPETSPVATIEAQRA